MGRLPLPEVPLGGLPSPEAYRSPLRNRSLRDLSLILLKFFLFSRFLFHTEEEALLTSSRSGGHLFRRLKRRNGAIFMAFLSISVNG